MRKRIRCFIPALLLLSILCSAGNAGQEIRPGRLTKCPVCGMFVARYPDWLAMLEFADGSTAWFDGPKDLLTYYFSPGKYSPTEKPREITRGRVTEYYGFRPLDMKEAYYVAGSDVYGPMGKELVPFADPDAAAEFMRDHKGEKILRFDEISLEIVKGL